MTAHDARTQTIAAWTGLPKKNIRRLRGTHLVGPDEDPVMRHRGPAPNSGTFFFRSHRRRNEAAALAGICYQFDLIPTQPMRNVARDLPEISRGERLCAAYELYRLLVPDAMLTLEHTVLLVLSLAQGRDIRIARCTGCGCALAQERFGQRRLACQHCASSGAPASRRYPPSPTTDAAGSDAAQPSLL
jgi:hypothetical protein